MIFQPHYKLIKCCSSSDCLKRTTFVYVFSLFFCSCIKPKQSRGCHAMPCDRGTYYHLHHFGWIPKRRRRSLPSLQLSLLQRLNCFSAKKKGTIKLWPPRWHRHNLQKVHDNAFYEMTILWDSIWLHRCYKFRLIHIFEILLPWFTEEFSGLAFVA